MSDPITQRIQSLCTQSKGELSGLIVCKDQQIAALAAEVAALKEAMSIHTAQRTIRALQAELSALRKAQRWVPVSEMLPKKGTRVVVYIEPVIRERAYASLKATYETGEWPFGYGNRVITHWLPLPPAPEGIEE